MQNIYIFLISSRAFRRVTCNIGVDTAENEPLKVWKKIQFMFHSPPYQAQAAAAEQLQVASGCPDVAQVPVVAAAYPAVPEGSSHSTTRSVGVSSIILVNYICSNILLIVSCLLADVKVRF